ncbi:zinc finger domain-containing protein [Streptomyces anandii]|uniref:zinc finger domain-containing protein n=1 Tax=Streptomyces anandii TaxID=285454 RepID=UPI0037A0A9A1
MNHSSEDLETAAEAQHADLYDGRQITLEELHIHLSAIDLRLRQLARAAETPATPVELEHTISSLRSVAGQVRQSSDRIRQLAAIVEGDVPLSRTMPRGDAWGAAAVGTDREDFGGPAIIPTQAQLLLLASNAPLAADTTTYPEAMTGVPRSLLLSWESKAAMARRERERNAAVAREVLVVPCERCGAGEGEQCRTSSGWAAEQAHKGRQREAEARVDARLGYVGPNPVAVADA